MNSGLSGSTVACIRCVLARFGEVEKAVLYGSRAKGNYRAGSDIDLTLHGPGLRFDQLGLVGNALDDLLLPCTIDLSIFEQLVHTELRKHIERVGKVFYEREA